VRAKPARGSRLLEDALAALTAALTAARAPWMVIGGIAVIGRGVRRFTTDIDASVRGDAISIARLIEILARKKIAPRIDGAADFARKNLVLLVRHQPTGVDLDVSFAWSAFEHEALAAATDVPFGRARAPMSIPSDLVVYKAIAGRARDLDDIEALLVLYPNIDVARARGRIAELAELAGVPELVTGFDAAVKRARGGRAKTVRRKKRVRRDRTSGA